MNRFFALFCLVLPLAFLNGCADSASDKAAAQPPEINDGGNTSITAENTVETTPARAAQAAPAARQSTSRIERREEVPAAVRNEFGLMVPRGFKVNVFAEGMDVPRRLIIAPGATPKNYEVFVTESGANRVRVLRDGNGDGRAEVQSIFVSGLNRPYGIAFHPAGWLYVANTDNVVRYPYRKGQSSASGRPQFIARLTADGYNNHWTRNLLFSRDGKKLYVTVGSSCNTCEEDVDFRAAITEMNPQGGARRIFASGLRNPVGLDWRPGTNELWTAVNERDNLGNDVPPDYLTLVRDKAFYGWPYAYTDIRGRVHADPSYGDKRPDLVRATRAPTVPVQAHSAALGVAFYPTSRGTTGTKYFPADYASDAFLAFHGSWNRSAKTGYKVVRVDFQNGVPVRVTDFLRGFLRNENAWGRPVDLVVAPDGSLLFSDDGGGKIWRISYAG